MQSFLAAAVGLLAVLVVMNVVLTLAMIRRLRAVDETLHAKGGREALPADGSVVGPFDAATRTGGALSTTDISTGSVDLVIITPTCSPCVELARQLAEGTDRLDGPTVIILGAPGEPATDTIVALLPPQLTIAFSDERTVAAALSVTGYPAVLRLRDGVVETAGHSLDQLGALAVSAGR